MLLEDKRSNKKALRLADDVAAFAKCTSDPRRCKMLQSLQQPKCFTMNRSCDTIIFFLSGVGSHNIHTKIHVVLFYN